MILRISLFLYFIILALVLGVLVYYKFNYFSAFFLAVLISTLALFIMHPYNSEELEDINSETLMYFTLILVFLFVIVSYSITMAIHDIKK